MKVNSPAASQTLHMQNQLLKRQLELCQQTLKGVQLQYQALEEDFLHLLKATEIPNLAGKKIAYIGALPMLSAEYKAIIDHYKGQMITITDASQEAVCAAIAQADAVLCSQDCPNKVLCELAKTRCQLLNKPLQNLRDSCPKTLQQYLSKVAIAVTNA